MYVFVNSDFAAVIFCLFFHTGFHNQSIFMSIQIMLHLFGFGFLLGIDVLLVFIILVVITAVGLL